MIRLPLLRLRIALWFCTATVILTSQPMTRAQSPVATDAGKVSGTFSVDRAVMAFKGIPYAAAPVGELRWQPPQPAIPWVDVRKADHFSAGCMQDIAGERLPWTREFMAQYPSAKNLPVPNVWSRKGSQWPSIRSGLDSWRRLREGSASTAAYDGEELARKGLSCLDQLSARVFGSWRSGADRGVATSCLG